jgi:uncharacterized protein
VSVACRLIVMAKAPVAGHAKTRLIPSLGPAGAARLAARFLSEAISQALVADIGEVELCCDPDVSHAAFQDIARSQRVTLSVQADGDLGQRMARAMARPLGEGACAILVGTDAPALDAAYLRRAHQALAGADAVFAPAADGGYALVGLRRWVPRLFEGIPWSTGRVMALTRERLAASGIRHVELPLLFDVDEPADLVHVPAGWL